MILAAGIADPLSHNLDRGHLQWNHHSPEIVAARQSVRDLASGQALVCGAAAVSSGARGGG